MGSERALTKLAQNGFARCANAGVDQRRANQVSIDQSARRDRNLKNIPGAFNCGGSLYPTMMTTLPFLRPVST